MESFRAFKVIAQRGVGVTVEVKHRLWGDGRIRVEGVRTKVRRDTGGWYVVEGVHPGEAARVLYREMQDLVVISWPGTNLRIPFHQGEGRFEWEERPYRVASMIEGVLRIDQEGRRVADGHVTVSGIHLQTVAPELLPLIRPLAWGLTLRSERVGRDSRFEPAMGTVGA